MSVLNEFIELFASTAEANCNLESEISLEELKHENSLYAEIGHGFNESEYFNRASVHVVPVLVLARNMDQFKCLEQLESICNYYSKLKSYPNGESFAWMTTEVTKQLGRIGQDADGMYHYSCILNNKLYY
ncbi:MAG: hypothetical protein R3Y58_08660 [Eubacteriales bacterium]